MNKVKTFFETIVVIILILLCGFIDLNDYDTPEGE